MGVLLWIGYTTAALVVIALVATAGLFIGAVIGGLVILALCAAAIFLVACLVKEVISHFVRRRP